MKKPLDIKSKSYGYRRLIYEQYSTINIPENRKKIIEKAEKIYKVVTNKNKSKMSRFYQNLSCNFKLLEEKAILYNSHNWQLTNLPNYVKMKNALRKAKQKANTK